MASSFVVRIPPQMRQEMLRYKLNWSEEVRKAIIARLLQLKREEGYREMDRIKASLKGRRFDGAGEVIAWRRRRWSSTPR